MRKMNAVLTAVFAVIAVMSIVGCAGTQIQPGIEKVYQPEWWNAQSDETTFIAQAIASSRNQQMAIDKAKQTANVDISEQIETKVKSMFKQFNEETGHGDDVEFLTHATRVSKTVTSNVLRGVRVAKSETIKVDGLYKTYVMLELSTSPAKVAVIDSVKNQKNLYTRFRASESYKELEEEIREFEDYKRKQGMIR